MSLSFILASSTLSFHGSWTLSGMGDDRKYTASNAGIKARTALRNMANRQVLFLSKSKQDRHKHHTSGIGGRQEVYCQ